MTTPDQEPTVTTEQAPLSPVDVGVTLGELDGHTVVVAAFATAGITAQLQLPPASAAQVGVALLQGAGAAGFDVAAMLELVAEHAARDNGIVMPTLGDTARIGGRR